MYAQFLIHISIAKSTYNNRESTILFCNSITQSASYGQVTFIASRSCQNLVGLGRTLSFVFTDVTQKYTITHNTTAFAILGTKQII